MSSQEMVATSAQNGRNHLTLVQKDAPSTALNVGAVSIEQERAIAEAQGQLVMAKRFPRDLNAAHAELMVACSYQSFAAAAFYSVPNRGSGPSIRFAEEVARVYGNFEFGHRELSRSEGKSEIEVYAWDKEKNNLSKRQITVMHVQDARSGTKKLTDQADIDNKIANVASKQVRGRILALLPKWLVEDAIQKCKDTIAGNTTEPMEVRLRKMQQAFAKFGVTADHLERYLGHPLDQTLSDELADLLGIFNALKEGTPASDFFGAVEAEIKTDATAAALTRSAQAGQNAQTTQAEPEAQTAQATPAAATNKPPTPRPRRAAAAAAVETPTAETTAEVVTGAKLEETASDGAPVSDAREQSADEMVTVADSTIKNDQLESEAVATAQANQADQPDQAGDNDSNNPNPVVLPEEDDVF
jgi:hypothetical protein